MVTRIIKVSELLLHMPLVFSFSALLDIWIRRNVNAIFCGVMILSVGKGLHASSSALSSKSLKKREQRYTLALVFREACSRNRSGNNTYHKFKKGRVSSRTALPCISKF